MTEWVEVSSGDCCDDPARGKVTLEHDGDVVYAYTTCECGEEFRDVFTFARAERRSPGE